MRSFTISWTRYGYHGPIIEGHNTEQILARVSAADYEYCLIQTYGNVIIEPWRPADWNGKTFHQALSDLVETDAQRVVAEAAPRIGSTSPQCFLVNLQRWEHAGRPRLEHLDELDRFRLCLVDIPAAMVESTLFLGPDDAQDVSYFSGYLDNAIGGFDSNRSTDRLSVGQKRFLEVARAHMAGARRGIFLWNVESYDDIVASNPAGTEPIGTLAAVAAGFKPNMILKRHGFSENTRVVYFDYSAKALSFRKLMHEEWDGDDYPAFLQYVFRKLPSSETFYHLWNDKSPEQLDAADLQQAWNFELARWGSPRVFKEHWRQYRKLKHDYVHCDILSDAPSLIPYLGTGGSDVIWWSNAFFTVSSNWLLTLPERNVVYDRWVRQLAERNPQLLLYGFDYNNIGVNNIRAGEYAARHFRARGGYLDPDRAPLQIHS